MIKSVTVTNYLGDSLKIELARPELSGFAIISMSGLGPGKATINSSEISTTDGGLYNSSRVPTRNITLSMLYLWKDSIEESRHRSYKYFPIKQKVKLAIETDTRFAEIEGYVESNEPTIFSSQSGTEISIICPNPFFSSVEKNTTVFSGLEPVFQFPFSNESLTEPLLEFTSIQNYEERPILYDGDAEAGITITIHATGEATKITIYNTGTREIMKLNTDKMTAIVGSPIKAGDDIIICTVVGKKSVVFRRDGKVTNILNCLERDSSWFKLAKGENIFAYTAETGANNLWFSVENQVLYEGI